MVIAWPTNVGDGCVKPGIHVLLIPPLLLIVCLTSNAKQNAGRANGLTRQT